MRKKMMTGKVGSSMGSFVVLSQFASTTRNDSDISFNKPAFPLLKYVPSRCEL